MSKQAFDRKFTKPLLRKLDAEARKAVSRQKGQLLILADTEDLQQVVEASTGSRPKKTHLTKALKEGQKHAKKLQSNFKTRNTRRYNAIVNASVPLLKLLQYFAPQNFAKFSSNFFTNLPPTYVPDLKTLSKIFIKSSLSFLYCLSKLT